MVYDATYAMLTKVLDEKELIVDVELSKPEKKKEPAKEKIRLPEPFEAKRLQEADQVKETGPVESYLKPARPEKQPDPVARPVNLSPVETGVKPVVHQPLETGVRPAVHQPAETEVKPVKQEIGRAHV